MTPTLEGEREVIIIKVQYKSNTRERGREREKKGRGKGGKREREISYTLVDEVWEVLLIGKIQGMDSLELHDIIIVYRRGIMDIYSIA